MNVFMCLCLIYSMIVGTRGVTSPKKDEILQNLSDGIAPEVSVEGIYHDIEAIPEFPNTEEHQVGINNNGTEMFNTSLRHADANGTLRGKGENVGQLSRRHNNTAIPLELIMRWWSVVVPFANEMATIPKFPWMVSVQSKQGLYSSHLCSGVILTKLHVLSSCRCLSIPAGSAMTSLVPKDASSIGIITGVSMLNLPLKELLSYGQVRNAVDITIHPHCSLTLKYDYGVVELEYYLYFTNRVLPIPNPFETFRRITPEGSTGTPFVQENEICHAAGWPKKQAYWNNEEEQKVNEFLIIDENNASLTNVPLTWNPFITTLAVGGDSWEAYNSKPGDIGSGLVCRNLVTAILSHHSGQFTVFASLRPALSFLWQFYRDAEDIYFISTSSSPLPVIPLKILFMTAAVIPITTTVRRVSESL